VTAPQRERHRDLTFLRFGTVLVEQFDDKTRHWPPHGARVNPLSWRVADDAGSFRLPINITYGQAPDTLDMPHDFWIQGFAAGDHFAQPYRPSA